MTSKTRSEGPAKIIWRVLFGNDAIYLETTINSFLDDYKSVEWDHNRSLGSVGRDPFPISGDISHAKTRMEEAWTIEDVACNVSSLSMNCFIPPLSSGSEPLTRPATSLGL
uniref:Uncharacterized protein n=1 Tax=Kalanchoe fedtschenkoi TaxID=63787 RepID=A0A7N0US99_KALFE